MSRSNGESQSPNLEEGDQGTWRIKSESAQGMVSLELSLDLCMLSGREIPLLLLGTQRIRLGLPG